MEATTTRASTVTRSIPTSETRTQASITMPLSRTRSRTSMRLLLPATRSSTLRNPPFPAGRLRQRQAQIVQVAATVTSCAPTSSLYVLARGGRQRAVLRGKNFRLQWLRNTLHTARLRLSAYVRLRVMTSRALRRVLVGAPFTWSAASGASHRGSSPSCESAIHVRPNAACPVPMAEAYPYPVFLTLLRRNSNARSNPRD